MLRNSLCNVTSHRSSEVITNLYISFYTEIWAYLCNCNEYICTNAKHQCNICRKKIWSIVFIKGNDVEHQPYYMIVSISPDPVLYSLYLIITCGVLLQILNSSPVCGDHSQEARGTTGNNDYLLYFFGNIKFSRCWSTFFVFSYWVFTFQPFRLHSKGK